MRSFTLLVKKLVICGKHFEPLRAHGLCLYLDLQILSNADQEDHLNHQNKMKTNQNSRNISGLEGVYG